MGPGRWRLPDLTTERSARRNRVETIPSPLLGGPPSVPVDFRRAILAPTLAFALCAFAGAGHADDLNSRRAPSALSAADRLSYTTAFDALRRGDLNAAREA